jgi:hypothetical protein
MNEFYDIHSEVTEGMKVYQENKDQKECLRQIRERKVIRDSLSLDCD